MRNAFAVRWVKAQELTALDGLREDFTALTATLVFAGFGALDFGVFVFATFADLLAVRVGVFFEAALLTA